MIKHGNENGTKHFTRSALNRTILKRDFRRLCKYDILHGAYGIEAASRLYFGKHAKDLNDAEAVLLAGIPKAVRLFAICQRKEVKQRQETILRLIRTKMISKEKAERLKKTPLAYQPLKNRTAAKTAPYFYDDAMKELEKSSA